MSCLVGARESGGQMDRRKIRFIRLIPLSQRNNLKKNKRKQLDLKKKEHETRDENLERIFFFQIQTVFTIYRHETLFPIADCCISYGLSRHEPRTDFMRGSTMKVPIVSIKLVCLSSKKLINLVG